MNRNRQLLSEKIEKEEVYNPMQSMYLNDSDEVLLFHLLFDVSNSVSEAGAFPLYNAFIPKIKEIIEKNPEARAKIRIAVTLYGSEVESYAGFGPIYELDTGDFAHELGATETATALEYVFDTTKAEMEKYMKLGKKIIRSLVFHVTDGLPTSTTEEMRQAITKFDNYSSGNGKRRIQIFAATPDKNVAERLVYSDKTLLTEDYTGIADAVTFIASTASVLSSLTTTSNPITGETQVDLSDAPELIKVGSGITEVIPMNKAMTLEEILG